MKAFLRTGAASIALIGAIGIGAASAQSYGYGNQDQGYRHNQRSFHHSAFQPGEMRGPQLPPAFQVPLDRVPDARDAIRNASLRDEDGNSVGTVRDVVATPDGMVEGVKVGVGGYWGMGGKTVMVDARDLRFERDRNELTADMSKGQIDSLPAINPRR